MEHARDDALDAVRARLHAFLARRVESPEVADDLTQEVLLRLLQHQHTAIENPTAWLYRVARNVLVDYYRSRDSQGRFRAADPALADMVLAEEPFADDPKPRNGSSPTASAPWSTSSPSPTDPRSPPSTSTVRARPRSLGCWASASPG